MRPLLDAPLSNEVVETHGVRPGLATVSGAMSLLDFDPPRENSLLPFWFWNDALDTDELIRQIDSFESRGVYGFVLHPRVGLPRDLGWMSDALLDHMRLALDEARRREMQV